MPQHEPLTVAFEVWQIMSALVVYTGGIIAVITWLSSRFGTLLTVKEFRSKHEALELRLRTIEMWVARANGQLPQLHKDWRERLAEDE